jgi:hypothetical protein
MDISPKDTQMVNNENMSSIVSVMRNVNTNQNHEIPLYTY